MDAEGLEVVSKGQLDIFVVADQEVPTLGSMGARILDQGLPEDKGPPGPGGGGIRCLILYPCNIMSDYYNLIRAQFHQ